MAIKSDLRQAETIDAVPLLAEIEKLKREVDRLNAELRSERLNRGVDLDVETVLSSLSAPPPALDPGGRRLPDGRFIPPPITDGGTSARPEPGAPRVATGPQSGSVTSCEFGPDDDSATAFDQFFNAPDPQLDKIRRFLLD